MDSDSNLKPSGCRWATCGCFDTSFAAFSGKSGIVGFNRPCYTAARAPHYDRFAGYSALDCQHASSGDRATLMVSSTRASSARLLVGTVYYSRALSTDFPTTVPPIVSLRHFVPLVSCTRAISAPSLSANVLKRTRRLCT